MEPQTRLRIQQEALLIATEIRQLVEAWDHFDKKSVGLQLVRAADSISNNIAEGYGRSGTGERIQFFLFADGSIYESRNQLRLIEKRGLIDSGTAVALDKRLLQLSISTIEFCRSLLDQDHEYDGPYRKRILKRMWWRNKPR